jgi:hypothetical protein
VDCPAGHYCATGAATQIANSASSSQFSPAGHMLAYKCPPGYDCGDGAVTLPLSALPPGQTSSLGTEPEPCPTGKACPDPASPAQQIDCATIAGYYADGTGSGDRCTPCPPGSKCPRGSSDCEDCADGEYSLGGAADCSPCPPGFACRVPGSSDADLMTACPRGYYSGGGSTTCEVCPAGRSCSPTESTACPTGMYADEG